MQTMPDCTCIIIHYRHPDYTAALVRELLEDEAGSIEVLVVDNGSPDPCEPDFHDERLRILRLERNVGYSGACNRGAAEARGRHLFIMNNDMECPPDRVHALVRHLDSDPGIGVLAPHLVNRDGSFQHSFGDDLSIIFEMTRKLTSRRESRMAEAMVRRAEREGDAILDMDWVIGAAMMLPRDVYGAVGGFDEGYFFFFEDWDLCSRIARAGLRICYAPGVVVTHYGNGSKMKTADHIQISYRMGQLRFYSRFNHEAELGLLKAYLCVKFLVQAALNPDRRRFATELIREVIRFHLPDSERRNGGGIQGQTP